MHFSIDRTVHTTAFDKPVVDHWLERKIAQTAAGSTEKDRSDDRPLQRRACYPNSSRSQFIVRVYNNNNNNKTKKRSGRNVLFNDALNTFYLRLYCVKHMVMVHSARKPRQGST